MIAIFDMSTVNAIRYNSELLSDKRNKYAFLIDDFECYEPDLSKNYNCVEEHVCISLWSIGKIASYFELHKVTRIIISGQRIADYRVIIAANKVGVLIVYKMHGLYIEHMKRDFSFYLNKSMKSLRTIAYLIFIGIELRSFNIPLSMALTFAFGHKRSLPSSSFPLLHVDIGIVWSSYWQKWHLSNWDMKPRLGWKVSGNPDETKFDIISSNSGILYIYQTLVEDGRISQSTMSQFYRELVNYSAKVGQKIYVKWHPRGDKKVKKDLEELGFVVSDSLYSCPVTIGHYSSLLGLLPILGSKVMIIELPEHDTPESIFEISSYTVSLGSTMCSYESLVKIDDLKARSSAVHYFGGPFNSYVEREVLT